LLEQAVDKSPMRELASFLWKLHVTIVETDSIVKITLDDLPDLDSESMVITLDAHGVLHFKLREKASASEPEVASTEVRDVRALERHLTLPSGIDRRLATARFEDGQITVTVPKRSVESKQEIAVKTRAA
jgi:HSP20 family molecular chaperone IbpA